MNLVQTMFGKRSAGARSVENPATLLSNPAEWFTTLLGGGTSASGVTVSSESALTYDCVWRAVNLKSRDVAKLPLNVFKRIDGGKEKAPEHPAYPLLRWKPNEITTSFVFWQTIQAHMLVTGNGYAYIYRGGNGTPNDVVILTPDVTYPVRENGVLWYVTKVNGELRRLLPQNVLHIRGLSFDGLVGYSVVTKARDSLGAGMAAHRHGAMFFKNAATPSIALEHPKTLGKEALQNLRDSWVSAHTGLDNSHKPVILEEGMKPHVLSFNAKDSQFIESLTFSVRVVANWFGVPPHKLGDMTGRSYASLEEENQAYLDESLDGDLVNSELECRDKLLSEQEKRADSHVIEFNRGALVRANMERRFAAYTSAIAAGGWMSRDEARNRENMNPMPNGEGKKFLKPLNMEVVGEEPEEEEPAPEPETVPAEPVEEEESARFEPPQEVLETHRELIVEVVRRMTKRIAVHAKKAAKRPETFCAWVDGGLRKDHYEVFCDAVRPAARAVESLRDGDADERIAWLADAYFANLRTKMEEAADLPPDQLADAVGRYVAFDQEKSPEWLANAMITRSIVYGAAAN